MAEIFTQKTEVRGGGRGDGGHQHWKATSGTDEETFKIQIGISKINNFTFKCYIVLTKID